MWLADKCLQKATAFSENKLFFEKHIFVLLKNILVLFRSTLVI